jgi:hypothetical protein
MTKLKREPVARVLRDEDPFLPTLFFIFQELIGDGWASTDPLLLFRELEEFTGIAQLSVDVENRINALLLVVQSDAFYEDPVSFLAVCNTVNNGDPDLDEWELPALEEALWAGLELQFLDADPPNFSEAVGEVLAQIVKDEASDDEAFDTTYFQTQYETMKAQLGLLTDTVRQWPAELPFLKKADAYA